MTAAIPTFWTASLSRWNICHCATWWWRLTVSPSLLSRHSVSHDGQDFHNVPLTGRRRRWGVQGGTQCPGWRCHLYGTDRWNHVLVVLKLVCHSAAVMTSQLTLPQELPCLFLTWLKSPLPMDFSLLEKARVFQEGNHYFSSAMDRVSLSMWIQKALSILSIARWDGSHTLSPT